MTDELELMIQVKDFGIGISDDDMKNLFNPFFRSTNSTNLE